MKKIYIILLSIIGVISSCTKHEDIIDTSLQPGSILTHPVSSHHLSVNPMYEMQFPVFDIPVPYTYS